MLAVIKISTHDIFLTASVIGPHRLQILERAATQSFPISGIRNAAMTALRILNLTMVRTGHGFIL